MKKHNPSSFSYALKTGSDQKTCSQNYYICPRFWCPLSKVSISAENEGCPISGENPVPRIENNIHPYFLKPSSHQEGLLLPCCGVTSQHIAGTLMNFNTIKWNLQNLSQSLKCSAPLNLNCITYWSPTYTKLLQLHFS